MEQLVAETERGLLVSRFWYVRTVDRKRAIVTGMTRDGTFPVENGRVANGVRNMRFNVSILDLLQHCELSNEQRRTGSYHSPPVVPTAKISGFTFTSVTDFNSPRVIPSGSAKRRSQRSPDEGLKRRGV